MKALVVTSLSGPDALAIEEVPGPVLKPEQTLVRVAAGGLNFADFMTTRGGYPGTPAPPLIAGREFSGVEENTGRRVMGYTQWAAFAERMAAYSDLLWPIPEHWTDEQGAAFPVNYFTAYLAYWQAGMTQPPATGGKHRVLIHAVAGGVGTAAVQIGRILGVEMYGTSSSDEKLDRVRELGLQHGINYKRHDYEELVKNLTHGEGVDAVFEMLGGEHTAKSLRCCRPFGRVIIYGTATGQRHQFDSGIMMAKSLSAHGLWLSVLAKDRDLIDRTLRAMQPWIEQGKLHPEIGHTLPMDQAGEAHRLLLGRANYGKIVLEIE
jgi:NADPH2:quinone reductase